MPVPEPLKVFVYGTLKPGYVNYQRYCVGWVVQEQPALAQGQLYDLGVGYPAMTLGDGWVQGFVLWFAHPQILEQLDRLEGYQPGRPAPQNLYDRHLIEVFSVEEQPFGTAWAYRMALTTVQQLKGHHLPQGSWHEISSRS